MSIELQVIETEVLPVEFNYDEIKTKLTEVMGKYNNLVITPESIAEGKKTRAELNKLDKDLNTEAIAIDKKKSEPIKIFRGKINELRDIIKIPCGKIDLQIKQFEDDEKATKTKELKSIFDETIRLITEPIPEISFDYIFDEKWLNAGVTIKKATELMTDRLNSIARDYVCILNMKSEFEVQLLDCYDKHEDLALVITEKARLEKIKADNEAKKAEELEKAQAQVVESVNTGMANMFEVKQPETVSAPVTIIHQPINVKRNMVVVRAELSDNEILSLEQYFKSNNLPFELSFE